ASVLKQQGKLNSNTVNVYTDYFVNQIWGITGIDFHLAPSMMVKKHLLAMGVPEKRIFVTGIPVNPVFYEISAEQTDDRHISVLITGGNLGMGSIKRLLPDKGGSPHVHYHVLCGKNKALYRQLRYANHLNVTPYAYISEKEAMNRLYDRVDC